MGKIFCKIINERLKTWISNKKFLVHEQTGFRKRFSTVDNILVLNILVEKVIKHKEGKLYACFIDMEKALDLVDREILWGNLYKLGISSKLLNLLKGIYKRVELRVMANKGRLSESFIVNKGVPQGCQLSLLLFAIFINDIIDFFSNTETHAPWVGGRI